MSIATYLERRGELETYFDRTAVDAWAKLTSDAPVGRIRATVRAGRDEMRNTLLSWLPQNMSGARLLDAGCGTGALSIEAARRGARVVAIDLSPTLVSVARERLPSDLNSSAIEFRSGDMLDPKLGKFDFVVAMDLLIHYRPADTCRSWRGWPSAPRIRCCYVRPENSGPGRHACRRPAFSPRRSCTGDRAGSRTKLRRLLIADEGLERWQIGRTHRVASGFYKSQALEMIPR